MGPLVRGVTDEIQTVFAFVVGKGLRAQRRERTLTIPKTGTSA